MYTPTYFKNKMLPINKIKFSLYYVYGTKSEKSSDFLYTFFSIKLSQKMYSNNKSTPCNPFRNLSSLKDCR